MEIVKLRLILVAIVMAGFGLAFSLRPIAKPIQRTEAWLQGVTPTKLGGYRALPGPNGDKQTYRMSPQIYELIGAYGIDSLTFTDGRRSLDVCVIAANNRESFHDPTVCFPAQDWKILEASVISVATKTRGSIPFTLLHTQHAGGGPVFALYTYKAPVSMVTSEGDLYAQWSRVSFMSGDPQEGAFYRFIGDEGTTEAELVRFAADFMDAIKSSSKGIL